MVFSMQAYARKALPYIHRIRVEVAIPAPRGMVAHARGDWESVIAQLRSILPRLYEIGGSHAQRELFEQVYLDSWLQAEQNHGALRLLEKAMAARRYLPL